MDVLIICSKKNYGLVPAYKEKLEKAGHRVFLPNCIDNPNSEQEAKDSGKHREFKQLMYRQSEGTIVYMDAVFVINPDRDGIAGYIGGATFLEMYDAFKHNKKIYTLNRITQRVFMDEADGFGYEVVSDVSDIPKQ